MIRCYPDHEQLSRAAAEYFVQQSRKAVAKQGYFSVVLSGGNTPRRTYEILAQPAFQKQIDWNHLFIFWGDERCVPLNSPQSNYHMVQQALLEDVPVPKNQIFPMNCVTNPDIAAESYEKQIRQFFAGRKPQFDLIFLGLGENGHTASLFPFSPVLTEENKWVVLVYLPEQNMYRLTMAPSLLNQGKKIVFIVAGSEKAQVLSKILYGPSNPQKLPAQLIKSIHGETIWLLDQDAAQFIPQDDLSALTALDS